MPVSPFFSDVGSVLFAGEESFFYTSNPTGGATGPWWRCQKAGPCQRPVRPAWRRAAPPRVGADALCVFRSTVYGGQPNGFAVRVCHALCIADAPVARRQCKTLKHPRSPGCSCHDHRVARSVHASIQEWLACPAASQIRASMYSYIFDGNALSAKNSKRRGRAHPHIVLKGESKPQ